MTKSILPEDKQPALAAAEAEPAAELASLREENATLRRLIQARDGYFSMVVHELRTVLTPIRGFSELIRDYDLTPAETKEYAADINREIVRLNQMLTGLLKPDQLE